MEYYLVNSEQKLRRISVQWTQTSMNKAVGGIANNSCSALSLPEWDRYTWSHTMSRIST